MSNRVSPPPQSQARRVIGSGRVAALPTTLPWVQAPFSRADRKQRVVGVSGRLGTRAGATRRLWLPTQVGAREPHWVSRGWLNRDPAPRGAEPWVAAVRG